jgi:hypothetical protein
VNLFFLTLKEVLEKYKKSFKSINSSPQEFLYDLLIVRAKLESLKLFFYFFDMISGDEEYYTWANKTLDLKPDLLPLNVISGGMKISLNSRIDVFAKNLCLLLKIKGKNLD